VLALLNSVWPFHIEADASDYATGVVLLQLSMEVAPDLIPVKES
jgi:hypothetical protein